MTKNDLTDLVNIVIKAIAAEVHATDLQRQEWAAERRETLINKIISSGLIKVD